MLVLLVLWDVLLIVGLRVGLFAVVLGRGGVGVAVIDVLQSLSVRQR